MRARDADFHRLQCKAGHVVFRPDTRPPPFLHHSLFDIRYSHRACATALCSPLPALRPTLRTQLDARDVLMDGGFRCAGATCRVAETGFGNRWGTPPRAGHSMARSGTPY